MTFDFLRAGGSAAAFCAAVALAVSGCGSGDDADGDAGGSGDAAAKTSEQPPAARDSGTPEDRIRATYAALIDAFYDHDAAEFCALMSEAGKRQMIEATGAKDCETHVDKLVALDKTGRPGDAKPKLVKVTVRGDRALAVAKTPRSLRYGVKFAQEGDTWVVDGAPTQ